MSKKVRVHGRIYDDIPFEIRAEVDRLLVEPNTTYDDIKMYLDGEGFDISRSAIGRYGKRFLAQYQRLRIIEDQARVLISEVGDSLILEEAATKLLVRKVVEMGLDEDFDLKKLVILLGEFAKLQKASVARERLKMDFKKKVDKVVEKIEQKVKKSLDPETIKIIKEDLYGLV